MTSRGVAYLQAGQLYLVRGSSSVGLTARGRTMRVPKDQTVSFRHPNKYYNVVLEHTQGPLVGIRIHFHCVVMKPKRSQELCHCSAYSYPHRKGAGKCKTKK